MAQTHSAVDLTVEDEKDEFAIDKDKVEVLLDAKQRIEDLFEVIFISQNIR